MNDTARIDTATAAAGEHASNNCDIQGLSASVDCLQLDATRCDGYAGWLHGHTIATAHDREVPPHCGPAVYAPIAAFIANPRHVEYVVDHARLEPLLLEGLPPVREGALRPLSSTPGHDMALAGTAEKYLT